VDCEAGDARGRSACHFINGHRRSVARQDFGGRTATPRLFYLFPTVLVATIYGSAPAAVCTIAAAICAAFFLYEPLYSFYVDNPLDLGELGCFVGLALIGSKCTADLLRPAFIAPTKSGD